jgi:translocation and assembly module TamB
LIQEDQILVSALKIKKGDSYILAGGYTQDPISNIKFDEVNIKMKTHLQLDQLRTEVMPFLKNVKIPEMTGVVESQTQITKNTQDTLSAETKILLDGLKVDQYTVGHVVGIVNYKNDVLRSPQIQVQNSMGKVKLKDIQVNLTTNGDYSFRISTEDSQLQELLRNLGLGQVDVLLTMKADLPCRGQFKQNTLLRCEGEANVSKLRVYNPHLDIAKVESASIKGSVEVTKSLVNFEGDVSAGKNTYGHSKGFVNYEKGFHIEYEAPSVDLKDADIANLELRGIAKNLKGSTQGNSKTATFNIDTSGKDFFIKKYYLGNMSSKISYKSGTLKFNDIDGMLRTTKYKGNLAVHLDNETSIKGSLQSSYTELSDIQKAFAQIVQLPVEFYGSGEGSADFSGPLDFSRLSYVLKSRFINGNVANESFDELVFNVTSKDGHVKADKAYMKKSGGTLTLTGTAEPTGKIDTKWAGRNFTLQGINTFAKEDMNIDGDLNFDLSLTDYILKPKSLMTGTLTHTRISEEKVADSKFSLSFGKSNIEGTGELLGKKIVGKFMLPLSYGAPFSINAKVNQWDFVPLLHLISSKSRAQEFSTNLTGDIDVSSEKNGIWGANGEINIKTLQVQRGIKQFEINEPINIQLTQGHAEIKKFLLRGDNTSLEVSGAKSSKYPISLALNGKIDLGMLSFLTPFLDDMRGILALTSQISFRPQGWDIVGSGFISQTYIRTDVLPHTFDNIQADLLFNENKVLINKISSDFAGGKITGSGSLELRGLMNIKTDIQGKFDNVTLRIPRDVLTKGSGDYHITGGGFPYTFQGSYIIQSGLFAKQMDENDKEQKSFTRLQLLPESVLKKTNELMIFDLDLIFSRGIEIKNDIVESKAYGQLHMKGPPTAPVFTGQIQLQRNGKIYFNDSEFEIETGELRFNDANKTNPDIYISANTTAEELAENNRVQRYEINMLVQGKADKYNIALTSTPPLEQKDIISLLAIGVSNQSTVGPTGGNQNQFSESQLSRQSYGVGASLLTKNKFGRDFQSKTGLQVKVSTAVDQITNTTSPKITISKQWTPKVQTSASRTFGDLTTQDLKLEYQLNKNLSLIGSWVGQEVSTSNTNVTNTTTTTEKTSSDYLGLDLEYKFEFK